MRILHAPRDLAGQLFVTAHGQREIGHEAAVLAPVHPFGYGETPEHLVPEGGRFRRNAALLRMAVAVSRRYDVFHFHYGRTIVSGRLRQVDARLLRRAGRVVAVEFWGSDIRLPSLEARRNPYFEGALDPAAERRKRELLRRWADVANGHVIVSDHWFDDVLVDHFPYVHVVRQRVDTRRLEARLPVAGTEVPLIVHNPTNRALKGTAHLDRALARLRSRGLRFRYVEVHGRPQADALPLYAQADIFVEQLWAGAHGVSAVEAMSLGKPVVSYILPELVDTYPQGFPVVSANRDTIEEVLEGLITDPERRRRIGEASRRYAEQEHDCRVVARRLIAAYRAMGAGAE